MDAPLFITGAAGWLGRRLLELARVRYTGRRIRALVYGGSSPGDATDDPRVEIATGDLRSAGDCEAFLREARDGILIHAAGLIHPKRVRELYEVNVAGTRTLLDAAVRSGIRRVVAISSNSPCGCNPHPDHLFDEESPYHPYLNYGRSKMLMELAVREARAESAIESVILRPPWFYGPGQPPRQTAFFTMIRKGLVPIVGGGSNLRSMAYVDNLCEGAFLAAESAVATGQVYWIADATPYSMNQIVDTVERLLEGEFGFSVAHRRVRLPGIVGALAYAVDGTLQAVGLYDQRIHVLSEMNKTIACSIAKAERELGYAPRVALEEGMRRSIRWCLDRGHVI